MKSQLLNAVAKIVTLLENCGWADQAEWFKARSNQLEHLDERSPAFKAVLQELKSLLAGMGSFTDLPMVPQDSAQTPAEAARLQWDLAQQLDRIVRELMAAEDG